MRYQAGIVLPGYNALKVADAPTIGTATNAGPTSVSVVFTAPSCTGGSVISTYTAFACCGVKTNVGASSPIVVSGLTTGQAYTFKVIATNIYGPSYPSAASNSVVPAVIPTCATYTTAGTYSWVAPSGVTSVAVVAVGGGGKGGPNFSCPCFGDLGGRGGGGGALVYKNAYSVTPGASYSLTVGAAGTSQDGGDSFFVSTCAAGRAGGGKGSATSGAAAGLGGAPTGGYTAGYAGGRSICCRPSGGSGAGGYSGVGGRGTKSTGASAGAGGSGAGGRGVAGCGCGATGGGGGVGLFGEGTSGASPTVNGQGGGGGSCGANGQNGAGYASGAGGAYGGGGGGYYRGSAGLGSAGNGAVGAVRIVWAGGSRGTPSFPSTNVGP